MLLTWLIMLLAWLGILWVWLDIPCAWLAMLWGGGRVLFLLPDFPVGVVFLRQLFAAFGVAEFEAFCYHVEWIHFVRLHSGCDVFLHNVVSLVVC